MSTQLGRPPPTSAADGTSTVAVVALAAHELSGTRRALKTLLDLVAPSISAIIRPGDRVLVKPAVRVGSVTNPSSGLTSNPTLVRAVIEALIDCGARVSLGDYRLRPRDGVSDPQVEWMREVSASTGATLVSFLASGARVVRGRLLYPRRYPLATALLDADHIIDCALLQPHPKLTLVGPIKNMFNSLVGKCQDELQATFPDADALATVIVDVFGLVRPTLSIVDLTTICELDPKGSLAQRTYRCLLASTDTLALECAAVRLVGHEPEWLPVTARAIHQRLGKHVRADIRLLGLAARPPAGEPLRLRAYRNRVRLPISRRLRVLADHVVQPPHHEVDAHRCNGCGVCAEACPVHAIQLSPGGRARINPHVCVRCGECIEACEAGAVSLRRTGVRRTVGEAWERAKTGVNLRLGPVCVMTRMRRSATRSGDMHRVPAVPTAPPQTAPETEQDQRPAHATAVIVGAGPGLGSALARRFATAGMDIVTVARNASRLGGLLDEIAALGTAATARSCDATDATEVARLFDRLRAEGVFPEIVVYNVEEFGPGTILTITPASFEDCWRANCLGGFLVGREAARMMVERQRGTIIFTGATGSMRGRDGYINLAVGKFGLRALAQSMARELGPRGVHVAHVVIDGGMSSLTPAAVAENYYHLYRQPATAWTHELDLRPCTEKW